MEQGLVKATSRNTGVRKLQGVYQGFTPALPRMLFNESSPRARWGILIFLFCLRAVVGANDSRSQDPGHDSKLFPT
jgi:hypothetical protein